MVEDWIGESLLPITYSSELASIPFFNLRDASPHIPWFTKGCDDEWLRLDCQQMFDASQMWSANIAIYNHNLSSNSEVWFEFNDTDNWVSPASRVQVIGNKSLHKTYDFQDPITGSCIPNKLFFPVVTSPNQFNIAYRYFRLRFLDPGNTLAATAGWPSGAGKLGFGIISLGRTISVSTTFSSAWLLGLEEYFGKTRSRNPFLLRSAKGVIRINFDLADLAWRQFLRQLEKFGLERETWLILSSNDESQQNTLPYYGCFLETTNLLEAFTMIKAAESRIERANGELIFVEL